MDIQKDKMIKCVLFAKLKIDDLYLTLNSILTN